jgi:hypothetical protein
MGERASVNISELTKLQEQANRPTPLTPDEVNDYAIAALVVLRGCTRRDKLRVVARMRRLLG